MIERKSKRQRITDKDRHEDRKRQKEKNAQMEAATISFGIFEPSK